MSTEQACPILRVSSRNRPGPDQGKDMKKRMFLIFPAFLLAGCAPGIELSVLVSMMEDQENYFRNEVVAPFKEKEKTGLTAVHYRNPDSLEYEMNKETGKVALVKVPFDKSRSLMEKGIFKPLDSFLSKEELKKFEDDYLLTSLGTFDGKICLIPRKFETRVVVYSRSKVADAVGAWRKYKENIDQELKKYNGFGLPATYILEEDVNEWDYFDVFVAGWIWAHTIYDGKVMPRVAHRGQRSSGTSLRLIDRVFQLKGDSTDILTMSGNSVVDAFLWEAVYAASGVYNPRMWEQRWSNEDIWKGFADGEVFYSFMTQLDCFFLHGTGRDNLNGYFKDPDDMGVATMPQGCSVELDSRGMPLREGSRSITTGGWWWGIPHNTPDPRLSFKIATHVTSTAVQIQECNRFGMIPVRKDVLSDMTMLFGGGWITDVYIVSFRQLMNNGHTVIPGNPCFEQIAAIYLDCWDDLVINKNWSSDKLMPQRGYLEEMLRNVYIPKAQRILRVNTCISE